MDDEGAQQRLDGVAGHEGQIRQEGLVKGHVGEDGKADDAREVQEHEPASHGGDEGVGGQPSGGTGMRQHQHDPASDEGCRCIAVQVAG